ncbi:MAG: AarF/ABC1/UbiB kinase family protein [Syntrophomonadaceae bacterium]|nr:AarF/ABC1/UbiB kinase family protein [Syntrophomonadaceae bacterium]
MRNGVTHLDHIARYREIGNVLIKHGFGFLFDHLSLRRIMGDWKLGAWHAERENYGTPRRLRYALEELGPAFIKLGQLLSIRPDLLDPEYIAELEKLQNEVPPIAFAEVLEVCAQSGLDPECDFQTIDPVPLAAASIAQVHQAVLKSGDKVVIKVQRPGIEKIIETDLMILADMGRLLEKRTAWGRLYKVTEIVAELSEALRQELNFEQEGRNADLFYHNYRNDRHVLIPRVYWQYSSRRVLTLQYLDGIKISDFAGLKQANLETAKIAENLLAALFTQIYEEGFFHADPHPGNISISPSGQIIFYDFGQVGILDEVLKEHCIDLLLGMIRYDVDGVTRALLAIGISSQYVNREELRRDVARLEQKYYGLPLAQIKLGVAMAELLELSTRYQVRIPPSLSLMVKMLMTIESIIAQLDPQISIVDIAEPYGRRVMLSRYAPEHVARQLQGVALDYMRILKNLPVNLEKIVGLVGEGEFKIKMEDVNLNKMTAKFDIMSNRLSLAIIVASIIIGTALIAETMHSSILTRVPVVELGFVIAMVLGLFLAYSILRSGKF